MKSLRVSLIIALLLLLSATTLRAQAARVACKDGSVPKVGHFTCWGHGGVVAAPLAKARPAAKTPAARAAGKSTVTQAGKPTAKKAKKKAAVKAHPRRKTKTSAK
jgi:hypothetical protein